MNEMNNADQVAFWNDRAGIAWTESQDRLDAAFASLTERALQAAAARPGERVIDVGCGCGATLLALAEQVGPTGHVLGLDVSEPMTGRARERVRAAGLANVEIVLGDASVQAVEGAADLLFSRFGVMFFADPQAAFTHLRRAVRPGGRMLFAAWRPLADNPWFSVPLAAARDLLPPIPPPEPDAPGPFAFADADRVRRILEGAGWRDVRIDPVDTSIRLSGPGQLEDAALLATRVGALARLLAEADEATRDRVRSALLTALRSHEGPGGVSLPGAIWLVSALA